MQRANETGRVGGVARLLAALAVLALCQAAPALASDSLPAGSEPHPAAAAGEIATQRSAELERWRGRSCPLEGCGPAPRGQVTTTLAFGAAVGTIAWLSRRRGSSAS